MPPARIPSKKKNPERKLISPRLRKAISDLPAKSLLAFDFDGTLAPIRKDPEAARLPRHVEKCLTRLGQTRPIALISGRGIHDLRTKSGVLPLHLIGSHGFEELDPTKTVRAAGKAAWKKHALGWKKTIEKQIRENPDLAGAFIEDKSFSLTLHLRKTKNAGLAEKILREATQHLRPNPRIIGGHLVINLIPAGAADKGIALERLMKRLKLRSAFFIGDDDTDEAVFRRRIPGVLGVRILHADRPTAAAHVIRGRQPLYEILKLLSGPSGSRSHPRR